ncbi:septum formation protein Maf [Ponticoccus sp. SC2-23]|uniref:Maf family protein n=1 Tax=Alexandriicola marinus TaxID=2081710 RepID=UPI000FDC1D2F|nr:Maf family nucleotide pyrophosphatase [Alexandriicola marinus]MBM1220728.1 septum formation protein Maf [Ponticoccus sp. SC6-9]MBM1225987.1 septum formation protein Maf [Ponticoccus sp. SC6-15]MBM1231284.1 septum formation protein Maf [Ponticoccus sp. SC6-38]MBM1235855.1 septum formation protein Maf [Ponticoccus sp. SC6-45]MBM1240307.1 septum formation protein Maf [Ponticoccus sp. SC6-49]MBM1244842.1 septum formation protein Maf [Ponticoccus sp. SC2-64]MBM1249329.1 septum formation protei
MADHIILASQSEIRAQLLRNAGIEFEVVPARMDEAAILDALLVEGASPRDIADTLAELKAAKISSKRPEALVIGCDQVLDLSGEILMKPAEPEDAKTQLHKMRGTTHKLLSAVVLYQAGKPLWRHIGQVRLSMHDVSDAWLDDYIARNWDSIRNSVGAYKLEEEGVRLFSRVEGDYFTVLGLPLLDLLSYLRLRGTIPS